MRDGCLKVGKLILPFCYVIGERDCSRSGTARRHCLNSSSQAVTV
jgi:hypothetical protein